LNTSLCEDEVSTEAGQVQLITLSNYP
jgi:hypothetical protein